VNVRFKPPIAFAVLVLAGCEPAANVQVQELPPLAHPSVEARLGLPELRGAWRFAGWELAQGDTLGLGAELPAFGIVWLQAQKRDSLAGFYVTAAGRAPLYGEVRRDRVVSLVAFPGPGDGRYLIGKVAEDTLWLEASSLSEPGSWRGDARAAFVRSQGAVTPFRRVRGVGVPTPPDTSASLARADSGAPATVGASVPVGGAPAPTGGAPPPVTAEAGAPVRPTAPGAGVGQPTLPPAQPPATEDAEVPEEVEEEPEPEVAPVVRPRPRVIGEPVVRDTAGGG
jgi:hypothetical protein